MHLRKIVVSSILAISLLLGGCQDGGETAETGTNKNGLGATVSTENITIDNTTDKNSQTTIIDESTEVASEGILEGNSEEITEATTGDAYEETTDKVASETETTKDSVEKETTNKETTENVTTEKNTTQKTTTEKVTQNVTEETTQKATTEEMTTGSSTLNEEEAYKKDMTEKRTIAVEKIKKIMPTIVNPSMTELQKVIAIHDWIVTNVDYALSQYQTGNISKYSHTAWGGLETGYVVCNGYAELFRLMTAEVGIEAKDVSGYGNIGLGDQHHRWSQVKIDGKWYNVDLTWDDPTWSNKDFNDHGSTNYNYFLLSDEEFYKDHKVYEDPAFNKVPPSECKSSISIPTIIDASVTKRAVYFYDESDFEKLQKDLNAIVKTNIDSFAVYSMNGNYEKYNRDIDSLVAKTLGKYTDGNTDIGIKDYDVMYYERDDDMLVASGEKEFVEMMKIVIAANEEGKTINLRCVDEAFADDKENYDGDRYYNAETTRRLGVLYEWAGRAGLHYILGCFSGDGYADAIHIYENHDYGKIIVSDSEENAIKLIKEYLDSLEDTSNVKIRLIFTAKGVELKEAGRYLAEYGYLTEYNISSPVAECISGYVYSIRNITVGKMKRVYDFESLKAYIEEKDALNENCFVYYYDENITEENYKEYTRELYKNIGSGTSIYNTYFVRDGVVYIPY